MLWWSLAFASPLVQAHGPARAIDVDGDGWVDVAIGAMESVYFNEQGRFGDVAPFSLDVWADGAILADLDGDGLPDLCTFDFQFLACFQGLGRSVGPELYRESRRTFAVLPVDADGDGDVDLLSSTLDGFVLLHNDGAGALTPEVLDDRGVYKVLVTGDVDGDGDLDVVAANDTNDDVVWLARDGGGLGAPEELVASPFSASQLAVLDYDRDGLPDLLYRHYVGPITARLQGDGLVRDYDSADTAVWVPDPTQRFGATLSLPYAGVFSPTDLDSDGVVDLAVADPFAESLVWDAQISGSPQPLLALIESLTGVGVESADVDQDGAPDLVAIDRDLRVLVDPLGAAAPQTLQRGAELLGPVVAADVDHDGLDDVVYSDASTHAMYWLPSLGDGRFGPFQTLGAETEPSARFESFDLDRDGTDDLLVTTERGTLAWYAQPTPGGGGARSVLATDVTSLSAVFDHDADGQLERLVVGVDGSLAWLDDNGSGQVEVAPPFLTLANPRAVSHGDLDGDGIDELVVLDRRDLVLLRNGPTGFVEVERIPSPGREPYDVVIGDHDADGRPSVLAAAGCELGYVYDSPNYPYCLTGALLHEASDAAGQLGATGWSSDGKPPFLPVDWSADGTVDLVGVDVYALGVFQPGAAFERVIWGEPDTLTGGDFDGDGDVDLLLALENGVEVVWNGLEVPAPSRPGTPGSTGDTGTVDATDEPTAPSDTAVDTAAPAPADAADEDGASACGCRTTHPATGLVGLLGLLGLLGARRRRQR